MFDVIFDIDGTIADVEHRRHHVRSGGRKDWKAFNAGMVHDPIVDPVVSVLRALHNSGCTIILCSGRGTENRQKTIDWLSKHNIPYHALYMRAINDYRRDDVVKKELLDQILDDGFKPIIAFDDRQQVVDMWRDNGMVCAQVAPGDF
jgi:hypothetical protein